jgi:hypothetical protein
MKYKKVYNGIIAGFILGSFFVAENEILDFVKHLSNYEPENIQEACKLYEQCHHQPHIDTILTASVSASGSSGYVRAL